MRKDDLEWILLSYEAGIAYWLEEHHGSTEELADWMNTSPIIRLKAAVS